MRMMRRMVGICVSIFTFIAFPAMSFGATIIVDGAGGGDYTTIQDGIDAALPGDTVAVAPGKYEITHPISFHGKGITLISNEGPEQTQIFMSDPYNKRRASVVVFESGETQDAVFSGFTLTGGQGARWVDLGKFYWGGGGILCANGSTPRIENCVMTGNTGEMYGGGLFCFKASPVLTHCTIAGNLVLYGDNCGVFCIDSKPVLDHCIVWQKRGNAVMVANLDLPPEDRPQISFSCIAGDAVWPGEGNISTDPLFCGWETDEITVTNPDEWQAAMRGFRYSLSLQSPCLGSGQGGVDRGADLAPCEAQHHPMRLIRLDPGTYPIEDWMLFQDVSIQGEDRLETSLVGEVRGLTSRGTLTRVTVAGGGHACIRVPRSESPRLTSCILTQSRVGLFCDNGSAPTLTDCLITKNNQHGVWCAQQAAPLLDGCTISGNDAVNGAGVCCEGAASPTLRNCVFKENHAEDAGGGIYCREGAQVALLHCTLVGNNAQEGGGVYCENAAVNLLHCIIWHNTQESLFVSPEGGQYEVAYSCIEGADVWPGEGNISADPRFCGWASSQMRVSNQEELESVLMEYNLALTAGSPCIGTAGDGMNMGADTGICDEGASGSLEILLSEGTYSVEVLNLSRQISITGDQRHRTIITGLVHGMRTGCKLANLTIKGGLFVTGNEAPHVVDCVIMDNSMYGSPVCRSIYCERGAEPRFVSCVIGVNEAGGVYCDASAPVFEKCTVDRNWADKGGGLYIVNGSSPLLVDCMITGNGFTRFDEPVADIGGGIYCKASSVHLVRCDFSGNRADQGGGLYLTDNARAVLESCHIIGNLADQGGGFYNNNSELVLTNCLLAGNKGINMGAAAFCFGETSSTVFNHCTVVTNRGNYNGGGGAIVNSRGICKLTSCIVWQNGVTSLIGSSFNIFYSCVENAEVWPGEGNINADPLFIKTPGWSDQGTPRDPWDDVMMSGNPRLQAGSPCQNTGQVDGAPVLDLDGNARPTCGGVDMGAFEQPSCPENNRFIRGEVTQDGRIDLADAIFIATYLFVSGRTPACLDGADANDDGRLSLGDVISVLNYLYADSGPLPAPFPGCGTDPTLDGLTCEIETCSP